MFMQKNACQFSISDNKPLFAFSATLCVDQVPNFRPRELDVDMIYYTFVLSIMGYEVVN
jgi:hypothetical protein